MDLCLRYTQATLKPLWIQEGLPGFYATDGHLPDLGFQLNSMHDKMALNEKRICQKHSQSKSKTQLAGCLTYSSRGHYVCYFFKVH